MTDTEAQPADPSASQPTPAPIAETRPVSELPEDAIERTSDRVHDAWALRRFGGEAATND